MNGIKHTLKAAAGALTIAAMCGTASATPVNTIGVQVDIDGGDGITHSGFQTWPIANPPVPSGANYFTNTFTSSQGGPVTVVMSSHSSNGQIAGTRNRAGMSGEIWANLLNDFFYCPRNSGIGFGWDVVEFDFSGLLPGTNYEVTVWNYDQNNSSTVSFMAWGIVNPTNNPNYQPVVGGGGVTPKLARVPCSGPYPSTFSTDTNVQLYVYSGSFFVTADINGDATIYGWNDSDTYTGSQTISLADGFALGIATNMVVGPATNTATALFNSVATTYGPPTVWPYYTGIAMPTYSDNINTDESNNLVMGETFMPTRAFPLKDFYIACQGTTNSGIYILALYDLGTGTTTTYGTSFNPSTYTNLLSHPATQPPQYWSFTPNGLTNKTIAEFKFGSSDQVVLTNGHSYFLGFNYVPGSGSNDLVWERTTTGASYASGAAFKGNSTSVSNNTFAAGVRNFLMAVGVLNPNPVFSVSNFLINTSWPTVAIASPNTPLTATYFDPSTEGGNLDENDNTASPETVNASSAVSMSFIATNNFRLAALGLRQRGLGSSNVLFTVSIYDITNTYFIVTNTINKWPFNFEPDIDSSPQGLSVFGTNVDFYYTSDNGANGAGQGTNDQLLILTITNSAYQVLLQSNHNYAIEISTDLIGQNAGNVGLFQWIRDTGGDFQQELFPDEGEGQGWESNSFSGGVLYYVLPRALDRADTDPETLAGNVVSGNNSVRDMIMAIYAAPALPALPSSIAITNVSRSGNLITLVWNPTPAGTYSYSVLSTTNLTSAAAWVTNATGISMTSYTDPTPVANTRFYRVRSP